MARKATLRFSEKTDMGFKQSAAFSQLWYLAVWPERYSDRRLAQAIQQWSHSPYRHVEIWPDRCCQTGSTKRAQGDRRCATTGLSAAIALLLQMIRRSCLDR